MILQVGAERVRGLDGVGNGSLRLTHIMKYLGTLCPIFNSKIE